MRCVSYTRYTSYMPEKEIPEDIIFQQNLHIKEFIKIKNWKLMKKYSDRKKSEVADEAFQNMRIDGIARKFDMIIMDSIYRFGKGVPYAEDILLNVFYPAGIHFSVVEDEFCSCDYSFEEIKDYFKTKKYTAVNKKLHNWSEKIQQQGVLLVHDERYGYLFNSERTGFVIDKEVEPIIREIFQSIADGVTYKSIAEKLNQKGCETPTEHLKRVGKKKYSQILHQWTLESVRRIGNNTVYLGGYEKRVGKEKVFISTPPIIELELFEAGQKRLSLKNANRDGKGKRSNNVFIKRIFDKETGIPLKCHLMGKEPKKYQMFHKNTKHDVEGILYAEVMQMVVHELQKVQSNINYILKYIDSEESLKRLNLEKEKLAKNAFELFMRNLKVEENYIPLFQEYEQEYITTEDYELRQEEIKKQLFINEKEMQRIMEKVDELEICYSMRNPWIKYYSNFEVPELITVDFVKKWIVRIDVVNYQKVELIMFHEQWRSMLPEDWFQSEV